MSRVPLVQVPELWVVPTDQRPTDLAYLEALWWLSGTLTSRMLNYRWADLSVAATAVSRRGLGPSTIHPDLPGQVQTGSAVYRALSTAYHWTGGFGPIGSPVPGGPWKIGDAPSGQLIAYVTWLRRHSACTIADLNRRALWLLAENPRLRRVTASIFTLPVLALNFEQEAGPEDWLPIRGHAPPRTVLRLPDVAPCPNVPLWLMTDDDVAGMEYSDAWNQLAADYWTTRGIYLPRPRRVSVALAEERVIEIPEAVIRVLRWLATTRDAASTVEGLCQLRLSDLPTVPGAQIPIPGSYDSAASARSGVRVYAEHQFVPEHLQPAVSAWAQWARGLVPKQRPTLAPALPVECTPTVPPTTENVTRVLHAIY